MKRNILTIFLASPNDLPKERQIVRNIVERANKVLSRKINWHIELLGWEDTLPGGYRPQELINKDVDSCQLFLGILWRRWGQETGEFRSGFEEEFVRARDRRKKTGVPEIWIFFKAVDEDIAKDPGEQLKKVLDFKKELIESKQFLFKEFTETEIWSQDIYDYLLKYVLELSANETESVSQAESTLSGQAREIIVEDETKSDEETEYYPAETITLFKKINDKLCKGKIAQIEESDRIRLYLQSSAWFSLYHLGEVFGNHEINLVYLKRKEWTLSDSEAWFLVRSFIADTFNNRPGWYWFKDKDEKEIISYIAWLVSSDRNNEVRRGALSLLVDVGFNAPRDMLESGINDNDKQIISKTISLIRISRNRDNIDLLDKIADTDSPDIKQAAISAKIDILYLNNHEDGFGYLINTGAKITPLVSKSLDDMSLAVDSSLLFDALIKADSSVRRFAAQYVRKLKLLTRDKAYHLLNDSDSAVRKEGLLQLIELDENIDMDFITKIFPEPKDKGQGLLGLGFALAEVRAEEFIPILLRKRDPIKLLEQLDFYTHSDYRVYKYLAENHFDIIESRIRSDLDDAFDAFKKASGMHLVQRYGDVDKIYKTDIIEYIRDKYIAAAMDGLALNGQISDIKYARKHIGNTQYNMADNGSITLLSRFGDASDVEPLIEAALKNYGQTQRNAVETAYKLSDNKITLLEKLINNDNESIAKIAVQILSRFERGQNIDIAKGLLQSKIDKRREEAVAIIVDQLSKSELKKLLDEYISQGSYYYNVVTWIDRCLYSKGSYLSMYKSKLADLIKEN